MPNYTEKATFIQHFLPGLDDGTYVLSVTNELKYNSGRTIQTSDAMGYKIGVEGPKFSLPPQAVHSVFPSANGSGAYDNAIPFVVLNKKVLPWSRMPYITEPNTYSYFYTYTDATSGKLLTCDADRATWLAVLLLNEDDFNYEGAPVTWQEARKSVTVADILSPPSGTFSPFTSAGLGHATTDACQCIDLPVEVFSFIAPSTEDLKMMANIRQVDITNKPSGVSNQVAIKQMEAAGVSASDLDAADLGTYSIVMGNRLPAPGKQHLAVLVSLEGCEAILPTTASDGTITLPEARAFDSKDIVRLPLLKSWKFINQAEAYDFTSIFQGLNGGVTTEPLLRYYPSAQVTNDSSKKALELGYTPMNHQTRVGQQTVSWYRGPLSPVPVANGLVNPIQPVSKTYYDAGSPVTTTVQELIRHPDSLLRFNPETGLFDVSYATAWQLGQLLALQDPSFSALLYKWKQQIVLLDTESNRLQTGETDLLEIVKASLNAFHKQAPLSK